MGATGTARIETNNINFEQRRCGDNNNSDTTTINILNATGSGIISSRSVLCGT
jgi:hypothetical protein